MNWEHLEDYLSKIEDQVENLKYGRIIIEVQGKTPMRIIEERSMKLGENGDYDEQ